MAFSSSTWGTYASIVILCIILHARLNTAQGDTRLRAKECSKDVPICIFMSETNPPSDNVAIILEGPPTAKWIGVAFGVTTMANSDTYIGYVDKDNKNPTVSKRKITGFSDPSVSPDQNSVPNKNVFGLATFTNKFVVQFTTPKTPQMKFKEPMDVIWAFGLTAPEVTKPNQFDAALPFHSKASTFRINLSDPEMQKEYDTALRKTKEAYDLALKGGK